MLSSRMALPASKPLLRILLSPRTRFMINTHHRSITILVLSLRGSITRTLTEAAVTTLDSYQVPPPENFIGVLVLRQPALAIPSIILL